ncbi:hypothetical protein FA15DRAFT_707173 [Coprinopsis marcescibilis]|uniref:Uncharacterized protein n=1 Tax=Coprinopsis marcescibilis TaxID=230819 RepID=A0A5C3KMT6_COPMA|nr:hypothetical protein FA15DRAFT_707173 [Coprinopsis marcescibilis]
MNSSSTMCTFEGNPDIIGLGVTAAVATQSLATFVIPILALIDGRLSKEELELSVDLIGTNVITSTALTVTGFITLFSGLSTYHGMLIILMSWMLEGYMMISTPILDRLVAWCQKSKNLQVDVIKRSAKMAFYQVLLGIFNGAFTFVFGILGGECRHETYLYFGAISVHFQDIRFWLVWIGFFRLLWTVITPSVRRLIAPERGKNTTDASQSALELDSRSPTQEQSSQLLANLQTEVFPVNRWSIFARAVVSLFLWVILFVLITSTKEGNRRDGRVSDENEIGFGQILVIVLLLQQAHPIIRAVCSYNSRARWTTRIMRACREPLKVRISCLKAHARCSVWRGYNRAFRTQSTQGLLPIEHTFDDIQAALDVSGADSNVDSGQSSRSSAFTNRTVPETTLTNGRTPSLETHVPTNPNHHSSRGANIRQLSRDLLDVRNRNPPRI